MDPNTPTTPTQTPISAPPEPQTQIPAPVEPPVKVVTGGVRSKKPLWIAIAVVIFVIIVAGFVFATSRNSTTPAKTTAKNNLTGTSTSAPTSKLAVQGLTVTADATKAYTPDTQNVTASQLQTTFEKKSLTDYFALTGVTAYDSTDGHTAITGAWGTIGKSYNHDSFMQKVANTGDTTGSTTSTVTNLADQTVKGSNGKTYTLKCSLIAITAAGQTTNTVYCDGAIASTGYLLITDITDLDSASAQTALQAFLSGTTVTLK